MQYLQELEMNQFHALVAVNQQFKRECSFILADVHFNEAPVVITFVIMEAVQLA
jgi:hypothetical protein